MFAAQEIKSQARVLATDRGIRCMTLDYDAMRGIERGEHPVLTVITRLSFSAPCLNLSK